MRARAPRRRRDRPAVRGRRAPTRPVAGPPLRHIHPRARAGSGEGALLWFVRFRPSVRGAQVVERRVGERRGGSTPGFRSEPTPAAKLLVPTAAPPVVRRARLESLLDDAFGKRLTV